MINSVCGIGSTGRICTEIAGQMESEGHEVRIAYGREPVPEQYQKYGVRIGGKADLMLHGLRSRLLDGHGLGSRRATKHFLKWAEEYNPDLLWLHNIHGYYIHYELLFAWIKQRPQMKVRWTLHDCWAFTGHCSHFSLIGCDKWKQGCSACPQRRNYPASVLLDRSEDNYRRKKAAFTGVSDLTLITPSQWLADLAADSFLGAYPTEVRHNTINTEVFRPTPGDFREKYGLEKKIIILGVAGTWSVRKGMNDFVALAERLDERYAIVMVGLDQVSEEIRRSRIIPIARTDSAQELAQIYTAADVFFNPTYQDNYPTVNLEAQACGTRVITYDTGGAKETIYTGNSAVIPQGDLDEAERLIRLL